MDFYLVSTNPENTKLLSANGVVHYDVTTSKPLHGSSITNILRPGVALEDSIVAEIEWKTAKTPTIIRCPLITTEGECMDASETGIKALSYLRRRHRFSALRDFIGDDGFQYRWKVNSGVGCTLTRPATNTEIASSSWAVVKEGAFTREKRQVLRIQPCSIDIDLVVLTFIIMEKKRREKDGYADIYYVAHDEEPQGDCGVSAEAEATGEVGAIGEL